MIDKTINTAVDKVQLITYKFVLELINNHDIQRLFQPSKAKSASWKKG